MTIVLTKRKLASLIVGLCLVLSIIAINSDAKVNDVVHFRQKLRGVNNLRGKELRVVTGHFPPYISILRNSSGNIIEYSNHVYHVLLYLSQKLKFTYTISPAPENTFGVKSNETWNGIIGALTRFKADLGLVPMTVSLERYEGVQFSGFVGGDSTGILVKYPDAKISFTNALDMFSAAIWIGGIISGMAMAAISVILSYVAKRLRVIDGQLPVMSAKTVSWYLYAIMVSQGIHFPSRQSWQTFLAATWCLAGFVFVNIYNSNLISYMSVTYQRPEINSYHDLALATDYKATVLMGSIQDIDLLRARNGDLKIIADRIQKCSLKCKLFSFQEMEISVLEEDKCVSIIPWAPGIDALRKYNSERVNCRLALAYEKTLWRPMFLAVPKSSPYIEEINRGSLWFFDTGLRDYWFKDYEQLPKQCRLNYNNKGVATKRSNSQLKLKHFYLAFLILIIGYLLALLQFCREKFLVGLLPTFGM